MYFVCPFLFYLVIDFYCTLQKNLSMTDWKFKKQENKMVRFHRLLEKYGFIFIFPNLEQILAQKAID